MFGTILKATNSSFQKGMTFGRSINTKKVMKLLAFIFEQPSYQHWCKHLWRENTKDKKTFSFSLSIAPILNFTFQSWCKRHFFEMMNRQNCRFV